MTYLKTIYSYKKPSYKLKRHLQLLRLKTIIKKLLQNSSTSQGFSHSLIPQPQLQSFTLMIQLMIKWLLYVQEQNHNKKTQQMPFMFGKAQTLKNKTKIIKRKLMSLQIVSSRSIGVLVLVDRVQTLVRLRLRDLRRSLGKKAMSLITFLTDDILLLCSQIFNRFGTFLNTFKLTTSNCQYQLLE